MDKSIEEIPTGCITAMHLRMLAMQMDRLVGFHTSRGGAMPGLPCLRRVDVLHGVPMAHVDVGTERWVLKLHHGQWMLLPGV